MQRPQVTGVRGLKGHQGARVKGLRGHWSKVMGQDQRLKVTVRGNPGLESKGQRSPDQGKNVKGSKGQRSPRGHCQWSKVTGLKVKSHWVKGQGEQRSRVPNGQGHWIRGSKVRGSPGQKLPKVTGQR